HRDAERAARRGAGRGADREVGGRGGSDGDVAAGAGDAAVGRVGGRHRLVTRGDESDTVGEGVYAVVAADERVVAGHRRAGAAVALGEVDRAGIAGGRVAERVQRRHG